MREEVKQGEVGTGKLLAGRGAGCQSLMHESLFAPSIDLHPCNSVQNSNACPLTEYETGLVSMPVPTARLFTPLTHRSP
jgi:hypothetical protein